MIFTNVWIGTLLLAGLSDRYKPIMIYIENSGYKTQAELDEASPSDGVILFGSPNRKKRRPKFQKTGIRCYGGNKFGKKKWTCRKEWEGMRIGAILGVTFTSGSKQPHVLHVWKVNNLNFHSKILKDTPEEYL
ncbi:hypothetical protein QE152_g32199 [Popillia japonica]|uniref:PiggyBac transposable element-derived protein domain-containing protein n=1 Tax=Popillia japonica TaxID=7064 RepID=A0AAW1IZX5_POPJA